MHFYFWDPMRLGGLLVPYVGGQCQIHASSEEVLRGKVKAIYVKVPHHIIDIDFEWLATRGLAKSEFDEKLTRWKLVPNTPNGTVPHITFDYSWYYPQIRKHRVKLKGHGESCRFYMAADSTNISSPEE